MQEYPLYNNTDKNQYEFHIQELVPLIKYIQEGNVLALIHTEVPPPLQGQGVGDALVKETLDDIRSRGMKVIPACSFVAAYIERHPEYEDITVKTQ